MLDYDNSAFYYFAITLLSLYLIPGFWYALSEVYKAFIATGEAGTKPRTDLEKEKASKLKRETTGFQRLHKYKFIVNLILLVAAFSLFVYLIRLVQNDGEVNTFDPYQILGIEQGITTGEIKKAYRKLSLRYHPDKNIGDKLAEEMFMKIAKAYEALTDETSKENYEKYGNPDGKQSLEVSIGLPRIILDNPKVVLVLYLVAMVVVIPVVVGLWYANSKQYGENDIKYDSYTTFYKQIQETHRTKQMPEVMAASAECRALNSSKPGDNEPLKAFYEKMKNDKLMQKPKHEHPVILRGNLLLHAHVLRLTSHLSDQLRTDLEAMLIKAPELIEGMIEICHQRKWLETTLSAIKFSQCIVQGLWYTDHPLMQVPHVTMEMAKEMSRETANASHVMIEYLRLADKDKTGLTGLSDAQKKDVYEACKIIPSMRIVTTLFVEEEETDFYEGEDDAPAPVAAPDAPKGDQIFEQDLVTLRVSMTRENVPESTKKKRTSAPPVHAPLFPKTIRENWWLILTDKADTRKGASAEVTIHAIEKISDQSRVISHELRFMAPQHAGEYEMDLHIYSDCYIGLDECIPITFTVSPAAELPEYEPHPEDLELDNEPTLFEQVMAANVDDSSDDEDDVIEDAKESTGDDENDGDMVDGDDSEEEN